MTDVAETKLCGNCKKQISANNFVMHEMHCRRHIGLCEYCKEPFPRNEMEAHFQESHAKIKCPKCQVEVEVMHLEDHEENDCEKKPMKCVYCELDFPKSDLNTHLDYCGSRTEPCHKCGAFIMLRDQQKHSELACNKPTPPLSNNNRPDAADKPRPIRFSGMDNDIGISPNRIAEISNVFGNKGLQAAGASNVGRDFLARDKVSSKPVKVTNLKTHQKVKNIKSAADNEYDRMLAMQLANDMNTTQDMEGIVEAFGKHQSPDAALDDALVDRYDVNMYNDDAVTIPCEFCGQLCTMDDLIQHQSGCSLDRISSVMRRTSAGALNNQRDESNNPNAAIGANQDVAVYRDIMSPLVQPSVIDNLRDFHRNEWREVADVYSGDQEPFDPDYSDMLMLPCEFCDEQFPMDMLIMHQAVCEHNRSMTPAAVTRSPPKPKTSITSAQRLTSEFPNLRVLQPKPSNVLAHNLDNSDDDSSPFVMATKPREPHKVQKPTPSLAGNGARGSSKLSNVPPGEVTRAILKKYGAEATDRGDFYTRKGASSTNGDTSKDSGRNSSNSNLAEGQGKRGTGASRTRSTLDNLMQDPRDLAGSAHDLLGHIGTVPRRTEPARQPGSMSTNARVSTKSSSSVPEVQRRAPVNENSIPGIAKN
ncbi:hypothetical protein DPMN_011257, partial [Dreissena polymorpha]